MFLERSWKWKYRNNDRVGRPKGRWRDCTQEDIGDKKIDEGWTQDRDSRKRLATMY